MAAEFNSFYLYFTFMILPLLFFSFDQLTGLHLAIGDATIYAGIEGIAIFLMLVFSFKTFYSTRVLTAVLKAIAFIALYFIIIIIYRLILFSIVMLFI